MKLAKTHSGKQRQNMVYVKLQSFQAVFGLLEMCVDFYTFDLFYLNQSCYISLITEQSTTIKCFTFH